MKSEINSFYRYFPISRRDKSWGLYVTTAGETLVPPHTIYPPKGHPKSYILDWQRGRVLYEFVLVYISAGGGKFESKPNFSATIEPGHAFLLLPEVWHRYAPDVKTGWHEHWIGFDGEIARRWLRNKLFSPKNPVAKIYAEDTAIATFSRMMQSIRANRPALQQILAGATDTLMGLIYSAQQAQPDMDAKNSNVIESAITHIQKEFARELDMKLLAHELGVSYSWFRLTFTAHTGLGPHQYLIELRLVHARRLLAETNLSIKEISAQVGFEDEFYFSRLFRRKLNLTPSQWRSRNRHRK
jgi:AraC-like DNA-binding protein